MCIMVLQNVPLILSLLEGLLGSAFSEFHWNINLSFLNVFDFLHQTQSVVSILSHPYIVALMIPFIHKSYALPSLYSVARYSGRIQTTVGNFLDNNSNNNNNNNPGNILVKMLCVLLQYKVFRSLTNLMMHKLYATGTDNLTMKLGNYLVHEYILKVTIFLAFSPSAKEFLIIQYANGALNFSFSSIYQ